MHNFTEINKELAQTAKSLREANPDAFSHFVQFGREAGKEGALSHKTKELIALALGVAARCDGCLGSHIHYLIKAGATREEVVEAVTMAVYMGGGPSMVYGSYALKAFDELKGV